MTDEASLGWEKILDRALAELVAAGRLPVAPVEIPAGSAVAPVLRPDSEEERAADLNQLRAVMYESIRRRRMLSVDVCDESGSVLLPAGSSITRQFLDGLRARGMNQVRLRSPLRRGAGGVPAEAPDDRSEELYTEQSRLLDERLAGALQESVVYRPVKTWRRPRLSIDDLKTEARHGLERHTATSAAVEDLCRRLQPGRRTSADELRRSVEHFVGMASVDFDLLPLIVAMQRSKDEYLYDHCVNVALLSMAVASHLGLDHDRIVTIGLGAMLHDIGMLRVPASIRLVPRELTEREWQEIHRHPLHTLDMLSDVRDLPQAIRFIGYQTHERLDGEGYPRGRSDGQLHEYAKIVSVADVYSAMTSDRPYRRALQPYHAAKTVLMNGAEDKFDRALVRALLDTLSLFPIGSRVELSDGAAARVLRANPGLHTRPVVEAVGPDGAPTGRIIDLAEEDAPSVVKAG